MTDRISRIDLRLAALRPGANALEIACVNGVQPDPNNTYTFVRTFQHRDWVDGESLVQAGKTAEEGGINERLHRIEADLDALGDNVRRAFIAIDTLRAQLSICLNEIVTVLNAKEKDTKEKEEAKDTKDTKDNAETKNTKDNKDSKDTKDNQEAKHQKDTKDNKENKEDKDSSDKNEKENTKDALGAAEKKDADRFGHAGVIEELRLAFPLTTNLPVVVPGASSQRVFIRPDERPVLGERALNEPRTE
jgi:hypothetical protein